jgi:hypothetical protein
MKKATEFVLIKSFQLSLIFTSEASAGKDCQVPTLQLTLPPKVSEEQEHMITLTPVSNVIKLFTVVSQDFS